MFDEKQVANTKYVYENQGFTLYINSVYLKQLIIYSVSPSKLITKKNKRELLELLQSIDVDGSYPENYVSDRHLFNFLLELNSVISKVGFVERDMIQSSFLHNVADKANGVPMDIVLFGFDLMDSIFKDPTSLADGAIESLNDFISTHLSYKFLIESADKIRRVSNSLGNGDLNISTLVDETRELVEGLYSNFKLTSKTNRFEKKDIILGQATSQAASDLSAANVDELITDIKSPSNKLRCGYQSMNKMLSGGFENRRVYTFMGATKGFKSGTLINLLLSIASSNPDYIAKDPNKLPIGIYLTMENDITETYARIYSFITGEELDKEKHKTNEEIMAVVNDALTARNSMPIKIMYRSSQSISTSELDVIYDSLSADGYEMAFIIQDYIKRIRSATRPKDDLRLTLGAIVDEFSVFAKDKNVPVITATQLNRLAYTLIEEYMTTGRPDVAKQFGVSHVAESAQIVENTDYAIVINREDVIKTDIQKESMEQQGVDNQTFLSCKLVASRGRGVDVVDTYFAQPFENGMKLVEDVFLDKPVSTRDIATVLNNTMSPGEFREISGVGQTYSMMNNQAAPPLPESKVMAGGLKPVVLGKPDSDVDF